MNLLLSTMLLLQRWLLPAFMGNTQSILKTKVIKKQYVEPQHGVSSMKSIIKCSKGPSGFEWVEKGIGTPLPTLFVAQITHFLQNFLAKVDNPGAYHNLFTMSNIPNFFHIIIIVT